MKVEQLSRAFSYNGITLPDPGEKLTVEQVRDVYSAAYPEITSAEIQGPEKKGEQLVYTFKRAVGTKGAALNFTPAQADGLTYIQVKPNGVIQSGWTELLQTCSSHMERFGKWIDKVLLAY